MLQRIVRFDRIDAASRVGNKTRNAVDLAYKIIGKSPPTPDTVLTLHGLLGSSANWKWQSEQIAAALNRTVIAVDLRNHGDSPHSDSHTYMDLASDISQLVNKLSLARVSLVGHSMGGRTAMAYTLSEPSKVKNLIVCDISPVSFRSAGTHFFPTLARVMQSVDFSGATNEPEGRRKAEEVFKAANIVPNVRMLGFVLRNVVKRGDKVQWNLNVDALLNNFSSITKFPEELNGKKFEGPTLFIAGGNSDYVLQEDMPGIKQYFPAAEITFMPGVGHNVHAENRNLFKQLATTFLLKYN